MANYRDLTLTNVDDTLSPTVMAKLPGEIHYLPYYLPTRFVKPLEDALDALTRGDEFPLGVYFQLLQIWFDQQAPLWEGGHLLSLTHYGRKCAIKIFHNGQGRVSQLQLLRVNSRKGPTHVLAIIEVEPLVSLLALPRAMDALGQTFFGEGGWRDVEVWIAESPLPDF